MKKSALLLLLLFLPLVSAVQVNMDSGFGQGATLTASVLGNFIYPLQASNVFLYQGHIRVPFIPSVTQNSGIYYIYGQLGNKQPGNYSLVLSGTSYLESGKMQTADIYKNFTISNASADFSVSPGFVNAGSGAGFYIDAESLSDNAISVSYSLVDSSGSTVSGSGSSVQILPGETKKIFLSLPETNGTMFNAFLRTSTTSYKIPVFVSPSANPQYNFSKASFSVEPASMNVSLATSSSTVRYVYVSNTGNVSAGISINVSSGVKNYVYIINNSFTLAPNVTRKVEVDIVSGDNSSSAQGFVSVTSGNLTKASFIALNFSKGYIPANESSGNNSQPLFQTCAQLGGINCSGTSTCNGEVKTAQDGPCCLGACELPKKTSSAGKIIGWSLVSIIVILLAVFFILRYKKTGKRQANLFGFMKKPQPPKNNSRNHA